MTENWSVVYKLAGVAVPVSVVSSSCTGLCCYVFWNMTTITVKKYNDRTKVLLFSFSLKIKFKKKCHAFINWVFYLLDWKSNSMRTCRLVSKKYWPLGLWKARKLLIFIIACYFYFSYSFLQFFIYFIILPNCKNYKNLNIINAICGNIFNKWDVWHFLSYWWSPI